MTVHTDPRKRLFLLFSCCNQLLFSFFLFLSLALFSCSFFFFSNVVSHVQQSVVKKGRHCEQCSTQCINWKTCCTKSWLEHRCVLCKLFRQRKLRTAKPTAPCIWYILYHSCHRHGALSVYAILGPF